MKLRAAFKEDEDKRDGGEDRTHGSKLRGADKVADGPENEANHDEQKYVRDTGPGEDSHEEVGAEDQSSDKGDDQRGTHHGSPSEVDRRVIG